MHPDFRRWLDTKNFAPNVASTFFSRALRIEREYGNLESCYRRDGFQDILASLQYSAEDKLRGRPNPSKINVKGDLGHGLSCYKAALKRYRIFLDQSDENVIVDDDEVEITDSACDGADEIEQTLSLERDMQVALRADIGQLEAGLVIADGGAERRVASGFIDITAADPNGGSVVIELKVGRARRDAVAQVQSYMGDLMHDDPSKTVRGFLVASEFDLKAIAAARVVPSLKLRRYSIRFTFSNAEDSG